MKQTNQNPKSHHKLRSFFSSIFGIMAVILILSSITVVWLNRTLIDTNTYVATVVPIVNKPSVQNFIANKVSTQLVKSVPISNLATALLPASDLNGSLSSNQQLTLVKAITQSDTISII